MKKLAIQHFIEQHQDWEKLLQEKPYCLNISRDKWNGMNLVMFKYNQIESDFNEKLVRQCRGIILNEDTLDVVSYPFEKFGSANEGSWVENIDWNNHPYVLEKCDGSLIKVVKINGKLLISTNGTILASSAPVSDQISCESKNFEELFYYALKSEFKNFTEEWFCSLFEEGFTYMFELCTIFNRVVVYHNIPKTYFIGVRNNKTYQESFIYDHPLSKMFPTPKLYKFDSFDACIETAKNLPWNEEGYVITSRDFKRNKAKSLGYLSCHHLKNNGVMSYSRAIELVRLNEVDEVLSYFPEFEKALLEVKEKYLDFVAELIDAQKRLVAWIEEKGFAEQKQQIQSGGLKRKNLAIWVMSNIKKFSAFAFSFVDEKVESADAYLKLQTSDKIAIALGYKD